MEPEPKGVYETVWGLGTRWTDLGEQMSRWLGCQDKGYQVCMAGDGAGFGRGGDPSRDLEPRDCPHLLSWWLARKGNGEGEVGEPG